MQTTSQAYSYQFGAALARATSTGSAGNPYRSTDSYANSSGGIITSLALHSSDLLNWGNNGAGIDVAETRANVAAATPAVTNSDGKQACLFATGSPLTADSNAAIAGNPNASNNFQPGGASIMLGLMTLKSGYSSSSAGGATSTVTDTVTFTIDSSTFATRDIKIAMLNPQATGNGFTQLTVTIQGPNGSFMQTFNSLASAMTFFTDNVLSLGLPGASSQFNSESMLPPTRRATVSARK